MLTETPDGLYCEAGDFHIDPWGAVPRALITHAHGDHARAGSAAYLCADACAPLLRAALRPRRADRVAALRPRRSRSAARASASIRPATSSARRRSASKGRTASGSCPATTSAPPIRPARRSSRCRCDVFVTESTFALPIYRWDPTADGHRRARRVVGRQPRARPDLDRLLLHDRQGAAAARRARRASPIDRSGARHAAADDRGLSRRRRARCRRRRR